MSMILKIDAGAKATIFTQVLACIQQLNSEIVIRLEDDSLYIQGMDNSHVSMYEMRLLKHWFQLYKVESSNTYGFSCDVLNKILSKRTEKQDIHIDFSDETKIKIILSDEISKKTYIISSMDIDIETLNIPEQEYDIDIGISSKLYKDTIDELSTFFDDMTVKCDENTVIFGGKNDNVESSIEIDTEHMISYEYTDDMQMTFSIRYLKIVSLLSKICKEMLLHLHNEYPLRTDFNFDDEHRFSFYLAPKIDD